MKDTFGFPKTLREYPQRQSKQKKFLSPLHNTKSYKSFSLYNSKNTAQEQQHNMGDYYVLTNPFLDKSKQSKTKKNKNNSKSKKSYLTNALRQQMNKPKISYSQIGPQNIFHCKSLEKLQIISNDRSEEIKALMNEKGFLMAQNQDLKAKLVNPTYREQDFIQKIAQRQFQIQNLRLALKRKEEAICEVQRDYKLQIEKLKVKHRQQIANLREEMNRIRLEKVGQSPRKYVVATNYGRNERTHKPETTYNSYNPVVEMRPSQKILNSNIYRVSEENQSLKSRVVIHSPNQGKNYKPETSSNATNKLPQRTQTDSSKQQYKTYIGQDGYERRVYNYQNMKYPGNIGKPMAINEERNSLQNLNTNLQTFRYSSLSGTNQYIESPLTNEKIATCVSKQPPTTTNVQNLQQSSYDKQVQGEKSTLKYDYGQHNQNIYSKSLTFQCFDDFN